MHSYEYVSLNFMRMFHVLFPESSYLFEGTECAVCGIVCYEESHVLMAQFHWSWTVHGG